MGYAFALFLLFVSFWFVVSAISWLNFLLIKKYNKSWLIWTNNFMYRPSQPSRQHLSYDLIKPLTRLIGLN